MAVIYGSGAKYREDLGTLSVYEVWVLGRPVLEAVVDNGDPDLFIYVGAPGAARAMHDLEIKLTDDAGFLVKTEWHAVVSTHAVGGSADTAPDGLETHVDGMSVYGCVLPNIVPLMADVYVPKSS